MLSYKGLALDDLTTKEVSNGDVAEFHGIASTAHLDLQDDVIEAGAFGAINPKSIKMLRDHNPSWVIGGYQEFKQEGDKLIVAGEIDLDADIPKGRETYKLMKRGRINGLSVGFKIKKGGATLDQTTGIRHIKAATLFECSIVSMPANPHARVRNVKSFTRPDLAAWLTESGFASEDIDVVMTKGFDALYKFEPPLRSAGQEPRVLIHEIDGHPRQDPAELLDAAVKEFLQDLKGRSYVST